MIARVTDGAPCPAERLRLEEEQRAAAEIIDGLPEDSREVLLLYYREGQSSKQVAGLLGLSDAAVRKRLSRARRSIREELLARFGEFARDSAPSAAFTAVVTAAVATASPPVAAAALLTSGAAVTGKTLGKILLGAAGSVGIAMAAALGAIFLGLRKELRGALDRRERRELTTSASITAGASLAFMVAMLLCAAYTTGWQAPVLCCLALLVAVSYQCVIVKPRILARRHAAEAARDPIKAARDRARERWQACLGALVGLGFGGFGLIYGLIASGRI